MQSLLTLKKLYSKSVFISERNSFVTPTRFVSRLKQKSYQCEKFKSCLPSWNARLNMSIQNQELHTYMSVFNTKINKTDISDITFTTSDDVKPFWSCSTICIALVFQRLENTVNRLKAMRKHYQPLKRKLWVVKIMTFLSIRQESIGYT